MSLGHVLLMETRRCWLCRRPTNEADHDWRLVTFEGVPRVCCDDCWEKQDVEIPLDMTEDDHA